MICAHVLNKPRRCIRSALEPQRPLQPPAATPSRTIGNMLPCIARASPSNKRIRWNNSVYSSLDISRIRLVLRYSWADLPSSTNCVCDSRLSRESYAHKPLHHVGCDLLCDRREQLGTFYFSAGLVLGRQQLSPRARHSLADSRFYSDQTFQLLFAVLMIAALISCTRESTRNGTRDI
jgi:hypothetical protein